MRIGDKPIFWLKQFKRGLKYIEQLYEDGHFIGEEAAKENFDLSVMEFNGLKSSLNKANWSSISQERYEPLIHTFMYEKNMARKAYGLLLVNKQVKDDIRERWQKDLGSHLEDSFMQEAYITARKLTTIGKLRSFQYRLIRRALVLNTHLFRWKLKDSEMCYYCEDQPETIAHIFFECAEVACFWKNIEGFVQSFDPNVVLDLSLSNVIFNKIAPRRLHIINFLCIVFKQFIYRQRCLKLSLSKYAFINYVNEIKNSEKYYAVKSNKFNIHQKKWNINCTESKINNNSTDSFIEEYIKNMS